MTKISVEIEVPSIWLERNDPKYKEVHEKIYKNWAITTFLSGHRAEEWLWETIDKNKSMYKKEDGKVWFYDAVYAIEKAMIATLNNKLEPIKKKGK